MFCQLGKVKLNLTELREEGEDETEVNNPIRTNDTIPDNIISDATVAATMFIYLLHHMTT